MLLELDRLLWEVVATKTMKMMTGRRIVIVDLDLDYLRREGTTTACN